MARGEQAWVLTANNSLCQVRYTVNSLLADTLKTGHLSKPDRKFGPLPAELHLYLCNWTLSKADTSLNRTVALVPRVSALERVDCRGYIRELLETQRHIFFLVPHVAVVVLVCLSSPLQKLNQNCATGLPNQHWST